jgi:pimeloyl-ACP methyl ester carboxylesterase
MATVPSACAEAHLREVETPPGKPTSVGGVTETTRQVHTTRVGTETSAHRVAFLHGLFGRGRNFARIAAGLEPEAQSLLVDLPNHGASAWTSELSYEEMADLVANELRADFAATGPVDVVGHSMGGKVAMVLALRHADLVRRLVVIDISPVAAGSSRGEFEHLLSSLAALDLDAVGSRADADAALATPIPHPTVRGFLLQNLQRTDTGFAWQPNLTLLHNELETVMGFADVAGHQFSKPVMWMRGGNSDYVQDDDAPTMRALFPKTLRITIRDSGHWVHSEKPDEVITALRHFLISD